MASWWAPTDSAAVYVDPEGTQAIKVVRSGVLPTVTTTYDDGSSIAIPAKATASESDQPG